MATLLALFFVLVLPPSPAHAVTPVSVDALDQYVTAFYLAEGKLADFDNELDVAYAKKQPGLLERSRAYKELIATRMVLDGQAHKIARRLEALPRGSRELDDFRERLDELDPAERIAVNELLPELENVAMDLPVFYADLNENLGARSAARLLIAQRVAAARANRALSRRVSALADTLDYSSGASLRDAGARKTKIEPSTGPNGTISGSEFPANTWALTYDDGPSAKYTPTVLANLTHLGHHASFMWLVECLLANPSLPPQAKALGMSRNDHSWTHMDLAKASAANLDKEITQSAAKDAQIYGERPRFFRLPYGSGLHVAAVRQKIAAAGLIHVFWNVDSLDWQDKDPQSVLARVKKEMALEKHGIVLFHDIHPQSVEASKLVLEWSATLDHTPAALRWVTLPEIVDELNK